MAKHGAPDWNKYRRESVTFPVQDMAELAARLGSINTFDRRGDAIFLESFESGLIHVATETSGAGAAVAVNVTTAKTGGFSIKITAGRTVGKYAGIYKLLHPTSAHIIGAELSWSRAPPNTFIDLQLIHHITPNLYMGVLRYDVAGQRWRYADAGFLWQDLQTSLDIYNNSKDYNTMKVVIDFQSNRYVRAFLNNLEQDMSGVPLYATGSLLEDHIDFRPRLTDAAATNPSIYLDDLIVTQDEP